MGGVIERAVRFGRRDRPAQPLRHRTQRSALLCDLLSQHVCRDAARPPTETLAIDVRRMRANACAVAEARANDARHRLDVAGMTSTRDMNDVGESIKLRRLARVLAAVDVQ
jgi:hypothetical protein